MSHHAARVTVKTTQTATRAMASDRRLRSTLISYPLSRWEGVRVRALVLPTIEGKSLFVLLSVTSSLTPALSKGRGRLTLAALYCSQNCFVRLFKHLIRM